jgi:hypothetical protein
MGVLVAASQERRSACDRLSGLVLLTRSRDASHPAALGARGITSNGRHHRDVRRIRMDRSGVWVGLRNVLAVLPRPGEDSRSLSLPSTGRAEAAELTLLRLRSASYTWRDMLLRVLRGEVFGHVEGTHRRQHRPRKDRDGWEGYRPRVRLSRGARADLGLDPARRHRERREGVGLAPIPPLDEVCATLAASGSNRLNARAEVRARAGRRGSTSRCRRVRRPARP